ncbi:FABP family protein [Microbacterium sp. LRZ72]|uniref:FABP family protein n=1 Tax=Microbacterium sp. LRZ72 TaxID=2942481 RepID=UPI00299F98E8|nr:FABP family protein [Microbacterium sp. LRZ72]MDX2375959.1 FABP family protein [Microbacterium sp. LRZ72]
MYELPTDLPADLAPLAWLIGVWEGTGVIEYAAPGRDVTAEFSHRVSFSHDGGDYLNYSATAWLTDAGAADRRLVAETGFWRLSRTLGDTDAGPALLPAVAPAAPRTADDVESLRTARGGFELEAVIVHSDGISELYLGEITGPRVDLATDAVVRSAGAKDYAAATRMYGLVDSHLLWAWDIAAYGQELRSHASARLGRAE